MVANISAWHLAAGIDLLPRIHWGRPTAARFLVVATSGNYTSHRLGASLSRYRAAGRPLQPNAIDQRVRTMVETSYGCRNHRHRGLCRLIIYRRRISHRFAFLGGGSEASQH